MMTPAIAPAYRAETSFAEMASKAFVWLPEREFGFMDPGQDYTAIYDKAYWEKYVGYDNTALGRSLTQARRMMVQRHSEPDQEIVDVGIGAGAFVKAVGCKGFDVNPYGLKWLVAEHRYVDVYDTWVQYATFWDSLEHMPDAERVLANVFGGCAVSMPCYSGSDHVLRSRHFRPGEHCWYFTVSGFIRWMGDLGFENTEHNRMETDLGREDIHSFAFRRTV